MKKIITLLIVATLISCETKTVELDKVAGQWLIEGDRLGMGYSAGDQSDADFVMKFMDAYVNKDPQSMIEMSACLLYTSPSPRD